MILTSLAIVGAFLLVFGAFIAKDIVAARRSPHKNIRYSAKESVCSYLMLLPAIALICVFVLLPIVYSLGYAFTDYYLLKPDETEFVWLKNFKDIIENIANKGDMYNAIVNTAKFVVFVVPLQIGMALGLALLVNKRLRCMGIFKVLFFAPVVISLTVTSFLRTVCTPYISHLKCFERGRKLVCVVGIVTAERNGQVITQAAVYEIVFFLSGLEFQLLSSF